MRLSSLADYAVVMIAAAARGCGTRGVSATTLAAETGVPLATAQKLIGRLAAAGLIESRRGARGGIRLARPAAAISLAEVIEAVEGPIAMTACVDRARACTLESACRIKPHMISASGAVRGALAGVSIASLAGSPT